jgi:hypothetical protein
MRIPIPIGLLFRVARNIDNAIKDATYKYEPSDAEITYWLTKLPASERNGDNYWDPELRKRARTALLKQHDIDMETWREEDRRKQSR